LISDYGKISKYFIKNPVRSGNRNLSNEISKKDILKQTGDSKYESTRTIPRKNSFQNLETSISQLNSKLHQKD